LLLRAELEGDAPTTGSRVAHHADCPDQTAATELMLARTLIGEGLYQPVRGLPPADEQIDKMLVALIDEHGDRPAMWSPDGSQCRSVGSNVNTALKHLKSSGEYFREITKWAWMPYRPSFSWHDLQSFARAVKALDTVHRPLISVKLKRLEDRLGVSQWPGWGMGRRRP
jgi:hypothetical protein